MKVLARPLPKPRQPGGGVRLHAREVGEPRTIRPRGPMRPTVRPPLPRHPLLLRPKPPLPWWQVGIEMMAGVATIEAAAAAAFLAPMGIVADHYLDRQDALEKKPLFTPCGSEPHLREREMFPERRLSDLERLRRNLRWYADDDLIKEKLLGRDIDALKRLIAEQDRKDQIRVLQTRLNSLSPGSVEAQQLRQKIENLNWDQNRPASSSTAARAQAGDGAAAPAAASAGGTEDKRETLDELLAALGEWQVPLRPKSVLPVRVDKYIRGVFAKNPDGARSMVHLALANDDDMKSLLAYSGNGHVPSDANLERLNQFLAQMEAQGTRVTGDVLSTMTSEQNRFVQNMVLQSATGAMRLHLECNRFWVAHPGQPVRQVACVFAPSGLIAITGFNSAMVNQLLDRPYDTQNRSFSRSFHLVLPIGDDARLPSIDALMADVVLPPWLDHLQISYVKEDSDGNTMTVSRSLQRPAPRDLPRVNDQLELDQLLKTMKFENKYDDLLGDAGTKGMTYPGVPAFRYETGFDPYQIPVVMQHLRKEMVAPETLLFDVSQANRELVALANLRRVAQSSAMESLLKGTEEEDQNRGGDALRRQVRADVAALYPTLVQWMGEERPNGRHGAAVDSYLALLSAGLLAMDPQVVKIFLPDADQWTAANQRFAYRLLLAPNVPQTIAIDALTKLHPVIMTDMPHVTSETPTDVVVSVMGGIEVLVKWQDLSGAETKGVEKFLRHMMATASPEIQKHAMTTYMAVANSGYLSSEDVQAGIVDIAALSGSSDSSVAALALGVLIQMASWVEPKTLTRLQLRTTTLGASFKEDLMSARMSVAIATLHEAVVRPVLPEAPRSASADWSAIWEEQGGGDEMHEPLLTEAARAFSFSPGMLWSPLLDEAKMAAEMQEKMRLVLLDPDEIEFLQRQQDVLEEFITSPRRRKLWERMARNDDASVKTQLLRVLEERLKAGGTDHELSEIQVVRNIALGRPNMSLEELKLERLYLQTVCAQMDRKEEFRTKWQGVLAVNYDRLTYMMPPELRSRYFVRELESPPPLPGITREVQQLIALRDLRGVVQDFHVDGADAKMIYEGVAPLLISENSEVAYGAAVVANELQKQGVQGVDNLRAQYLLLSADFLYAVRRPYPGNSHDKLLASKLLMDHGILTAEQVKHVAAIVMDREGLRSGDIDNVLAAFEVAPLVIEQGNLDRTQIHRIVVGIVEMLVGSSIDSLRDGSMAALERLQPHLDKAWRAMQELEWGMSQIDQPWRERAERLLQAVRKP